MMKSLAVVAAWLVVASCVSVAWAQRNIDRANPAVFAPVADEVRPGSAGLFVGVNDFIDTFDTLQYAVNDAVELAHLFVFELKLVAPANCHLLLSGEPSGDGVKRHLERLRQHGTHIGTATRSEILRAFIELKKLPSQTSDVLVCALSSHGFQDYVVPNDGVRELLQTTAIPIRDIEELMGKSKAGHRLLLLDACQQRIPARSTGTGGLPMSPVMQQALEKATGQAKFASCAVGQVSYEHKSLGEGHGVFTYAVLEALRGNAVSDPQNLVRLGDVSTYVASRVSTWCKDNGRNEQLPGLYGPERTRQLPLAQKADDLQTLLSRVRERVLTPRFTTNLRNQLLSRLETSDLSREPDRELIESTRLFLGGQLSERLYVPYLRSELERPPFPDNFAETRAGQEWSGNGLKMAFCWCPPGQFRMGSPASEKDRYDEEVQVMVSLSRGFWLGKCEVTQGQWQQLMGTKPWEGKDFVKAGSEYAASYISWEEAVAFCQKLTAQERSAGRLPSGWEYTLPTEAQWEYGCRAGTTTAYCFGDDSSQLGEYGWFDENAYDVGEGYAHVVGRKRANAWGLQDMHGNVWEWCRDWYGGKLPGGTDPEVTTEASDRVHRGGSWYDYARDCRSAIRGRSSPDYRHNHLGFRVVAVQSAGK